MEEDEATVGNEMEVVAADAVVVDDGVAAAEEVEDEEEEEDLLFFLDPPPTGTFLRDPPSVQYLLQALQKYLGWVRL